MADLRWVPHFSKFQRDFTKWWIAISTQAMVCHRDSEIHRLQALLGSWRQGSNWDPLGCSLGPPNYPHAHKGLYVYPGVHSGGLLMTRVLTVWIQAGMSIKDFTMISYGNGSTKNHSMTFKADSSVTSISLVSFNESQRSDHVVCGPVIDSVILRSFSGLRQKMQLGVLVLHLTVTIMQLLW